MAPGNKFKLNRMSENKQWIVVKMCTGGGIHSIHIN